MTTTQPLLEMRAISKQFPGVVALSDVSFNLRAGEIHALMGENGAGKSTLIKVLTGVYEPTTGSMTLNGTLIRPSSPRAAQDFGISTVYQEVNLVPYLSVAENIALGRQPRRLGMISWKKINMRARKSLERLDLDIDVTAPVSTYSTAIQQLVAIARALDVSAKVLVLDEPTSSLDRKEVERLFDLLRKLKAQGLGIVFITHFLDEVYEVCDRITVLRNGKLVGEFEAQNLPRLQLIEKMLGRQADEPVPVHAQPAADAVQRAPFLEARGLFRKGAVTDVDIDVRQGEVLGLAGLLGSGRTETARILFGLDPADKGDVLIDGKRKRIRTPRAAVAEGFGFCPEDRKVEGIIPHLSIRENIILALQARRGWHRRLTHREQVELTSKFIATLKIAASGPEQQVRTLSGGNQQKVVLARWLSANPRFLILDEPTRGIDIGAKAEIERLVHELSESGISLLFISSELDEVIRCSTRVAVMRDRKKVGELSADQVTAENVMRTIAR